MTNTQFNPSRYNWLVASYIVVAAVFVLPSARLWLQTPMTLTAHEFDYFLGLFTSDNSSPASSALEAGRALHFLGFCVLGLLYLAIVRETGRDPDPGLRRLVVPSLLASLVFAMGMPWVSPDVFFYIGKGWAESHYGLSPYLAPISHVAGYQGDQMFANIFPEFQHTATGYGPVFQKIAMIISSLSGGNEQFALALHKLTNLVLHAACMYLVYHLAPRNISRLAALSYAINPLICFSVLTCAHNDHWMNLFVLGALLALSRHRWLIAGIALGIAFGIKYAPLLYIPIFCLAALVQQQNARTVAERVFDLGKLLLGFAATTLVSFAAFYPEALPDLAKTLAIGGAPVYRNSIYHLVDFVLAFVLPNLVAVKPSLLSYESIMAMGANLRIIYIVLYGLLVMALIPWIKRNLLFGTAEACLAALLLYFIVANSSNQEWYLTWLLGFAFILPSGNARAFGWRLSALFLPLVIYTVKSGSLFVALASNSLLYLTVFLLGGVFMLKSLDVGKHGAKSSRAPIDA